MTTVVLGALWALWPLLTLAGGLGFSILCAIAALVLLPVVFRSLRPRIYFALLLAFFIYAGISASWSPREQVLLDFDAASLQLSIRSEMLRVGLQVVAQGILIAAAMRLDELGRQKLQRIARIALFIQLGVLAVIVMFERQILESLGGLMTNTGEGVQNISRNSLILAAAAPVLAIGLLGSRPLARGLSLAAGVMIAVCVIVAVRGVNAGLLSIGAAGLCIAIVRFVPAHGFRILGVLIALMVMTAPWTFGFLSQGADFATADDSSSYRAAIWQRVIAMINEHPLTGGGLGMLRTVRETIDTGVFAGELTVPNHPHNMMLQLWAELGAIGAGLLSLAIVFAGWRIPDARKLGAAGLGGAAVVGAMAAAAAVSFDLWNEWWWAIGGLLLGLAAATPKPVAAEAPLGAGLTFGEPSPALGAATSAPAPEPMPAAHAHNNFNLLRLVFALMVVVYHAIALPGVLMGQPAEGWFGLGAELGVQGFFVLSGYLVWASLERSDSLALYAEKRARRLLPAYVTVVLACAVAALIIVPASRADLSGVASYVGWNLTFLNFMSPDLPGVFEANRFSEINGALWTLKIEVMFYLILPLLAWILRAAGARRWMLLAAIYVAAELWRLTLEQQGGVWVELSRQLPGQMSYFITGIALCAWRNELNWRSMLAPLGLILLVVSIALPQAEIVRAAGLGIVAVWIAVGIPRLFDAAKFGDLSYGLYIVHFPIIQAVIAMGLFATPAIGFAAAGAASLAAALLLWWFVERPALRRDSAYRLALG